MSIQTLQTRYESNEKTEEIRPILYTKILAILSTGETLTANEIAKRINKNWNRQNVHPRLCELQDDMKLIEENGTKYDAETRKTVTAYKLIDKE